MIKRPFRGVPFWARFWLRFFGFIIVAAIVDVFLQRHLPPPAGSLTTVGLLVLFILLTGGPAGRRKTQKRALLHKGEQSIAAVGTSERKEHKHWDDPLLSLAEMKCEQCHSPLGTEAESTLKNVEQLNEEDFAIKCPSCGALTPLPASEIRALIHKKQKFEENIVFATLWFLAGLGCAAGTAIAAYMVYNPQVHSLIAQWFFRLVGLCMFVAGLIPTLFFFYQFRAVCKEIKRAKELNSPRRPQP